MSELIKSGKDFVGYEYKEVLTDAENASLLLDCFQSFGWIPDDNMPPICGKGAVTLRLKRDRRLINRAELTRLQRNFESCLSELAALKKGKTQSARLTAWGIAAAGTAFMACSTFAATAEPPRILLCVLFALPGLLGWLLPLLVYRAVVRKSTVRITPKIEEKHEEIYEICEKGSKLLHL